MPTARRVLVAHIEFVFQIRHKFHALSGPSSALAYEIGKNPHKSRNKRINKVFNGNQWNGVSTKVACRESGWNKIKFRALCRRAVTTVEKEKKTKNTTKKTH